MKDNKFKTTLKCSGCVDRVTPHLNEVVGPGNWDVDLNGPIKVLTVYTDTEEAQVKKAMEKAGYKAELMK